MHLPDINQSKTEFPIMQLILQSHDVIALNNALNTVSLNSSELSNIKIVRLPNNYQSFTILKSPHVHKKSREQFQRTTMRVSIYIKGSPSFWIYFLPRLKQLKLRGVQLSWKYKYVTVLPD
uniref:Ribosomal protein S10 n=1 Tax=Nephroselmis olivacea TaxID=31312 RepID=Q9TCA8_NEPOL|nr:ribosomal protein S10 [Nephroselmis olivacea]AAF03189.1 ribosomal protein S10 [Nephroselmis olivacea]